VHAQNRGHHKEFRLINDEPMRQAMKFVGANVGAKKQKASMVSWLFGQDSW
jgi:hypothetical protein